METVQSIKTEGNLMCTTGIENAYRRAFKDGLGGSRKENTWNKQKDKYHGTHSCCGSKVYWRHKVECPALKFNDE